MVVHAGKLHERVSASPQYGRLRWRLWLARWLGWREAHHTLVWAAFIGVLGGLASVLFRKAVDAVEWVFTRHRGDLAGVAQALEPWQRLTMPTLGGLLAGWVLHLGMRRFRDHRSTDYMEAVTLGDGKLPLRASLTKCLSSLLSIGSGGSIGREGSMVQLSALAASQLGGRAGFDGPRLKLLVACGAAAGVAAAYNAPIGGALFVAEVILGSIAVESLGPLVVAALMATLTVHQLIPVAPLYPAGGIGSLSLWQAPWFLLLGLLAGTGGALFQRSLVWTRNIFLARPWPVYASMTLGGLLSGGISVVVPEVWGNGQSVVSSMVQGNWTILALSGLLLAKTAATASTVGSGAVGGVFTPTLFIGAALGSLFGQAFQHGFPQLAVNPAATALAGMAGLLAATTRAPLVSIVLVFEMTLDYGLMLPLMLTSVIAHVTSTGFGRESIYGKLGPRQQPAGSAARPILTRRIGALMKQGLPTVPLSASFATVAERLVVDELSELVVVDEAGRLAGMIWLTDISAHLQDPSLARLVTAADILRVSVPALTPEATWLEALQTFGRHRGEWLPVVQSGEDQRVVGRLLEDDLLLAIAHEERLG